MSELTSLLILGVGFACLITGLIMSIILAPKPWNPKKQWIVRSLLSSFIGILSVFFFISALEIRSQMVFDYQVVWDSFPSMLIFIFIGGVVLAIGLFVRVVIWRKRDDLMQKFITRLKNRK